MLTPDDENQTNEKATRGRPSSFDKKYIKQAYELSLLGLTDEEMANVFDVARSTFYEWKNVYQEFSDAIIRGKDQADAIVAKSLFKRATGYRHKAVKIMQHMGEAIEVDYVERYPPDTMACIYWLNNRQRKNWTQKPVSDGSDEPPPPTKVEITVKDARKPADNE